MAISEESRHALYSRLQAVLGDAEAATLMEHLPPVGWADVATKQDLRLELRALEHKVEAVLHREVSVIRRDMNQRLRTFVFANVGLMATLVTLTYAAVRLG